MISYTVRPRQTLYDAVIQATGTLEALVAVAEANDLAVSDAVTAGQVLVIPDNVVTNVAVAQWLSANKVTVGTLGIAAVAGVVVADEDGVEIISEDGSVVVPE